MINNKKKRNIKIWTKLFLNLTNYLSKKSILNKSYYEILNIVYDNF